MLLSWIIFLPLLFTLPLPFLPEGHKGKTLHTYAIAASGLLLVLTLIGWLGWVPLSPVNTSWLPQLGIRYAVGSDGLTSTLMVLTAFLVLMATIASITNITERIRQYYFFVFTLTTAIMGVFAARDLFLFFVYWELELIPMYFLIATWGGARRDYAALKFVLYTLFGSVFMLAAILGLYFFAHQASPTADGLFLFDTLRQVALSPAFGLTGQILAFLGFFIMFAVKLPIVPFHTWLPDAHGEAPTPISMLLAGILLKMGAYGLMRFCFGFFPDAAQALVPYLSILAVINIVYTGSIALVQTDLKRLVAYSSVSHMGFVLLGLCALNAIGFQGAIFVMISHGVISAAMFMSVGTLYLRTHTRAIAEYGGFAAQTPAIFYFFLLMAMASLGLPLLMGFPAETLVFYGAFVSRAFTEVVIGSNTLPWTIQGITVVAALGVIIGAAYLLWMVRRVFFGPIADKWKSLPDIFASETVVLGSLAAMVLLFGFVPQWLGAKFESISQELAEMYPPQLQVTTTAATPQPDTHKQTLRHLAATDLSGGSR